MLRQLRQSITHALWERYLCADPFMQQIVTLLQNLQVQKVMLDHFALIDLPGAHTGITHLSRFFSLLGYTEHGRGYLPDKQNDFVWMRETNSETMPVADVLPQIVVADFRVDILPTEVKKVIEKYAKQAAVPPFAEITALLKRIQQNDSHATAPLIKRYIQYFAGRDWPLPSLKEFYTVCEFNELLAWVLVFGRQPNHFTLAVHLLNRFTDLADFNDHLTRHLNLKLNHDGGIIKGSEAVGIAQSATIGIPKRVKLSDTIIEIPSSFVEFVWRYPRVAAPHLWQDFFTGFIPQQANHVIKSLYS